MKIISIKQPWASLIIQKGKDIENRTWPTKYRGPVLVHASLRADTISAREIADRFGVRPPSFLPLGGVIGIVEIVDCVDAHPSRWHVPGNWGFVLRNPRPLPFIEWKGALSITDAPSALLKKLPKEIRP